MFQNELDKVKAQLSMKGESQLPAGNQQPTVWGPGLCARWLAHARGSPVQSPPLSEAEGPVQAANCFTGAASSELFMRQDHLKLYKDCMTEPVCSLTQLCCNWVALRKFRALYAVLLSLFLITSYKSAAQLYQAVWKQTPWFAHWTAHGCIWQRLTPSER